MSIPLVKQKTAKHPRSLPPQGGLLNGSTRNTDATIISWIRWNEKHRRSLLP
jgi:hypothetical protein